MLSIGAVEPSWEKAIDPLEHDTDGESGAGLGFLLEGCELEIEERRFIHEGLRVDMWELVSAADTSCSVSRAWASCSGISPLVILLTSRFWASPSWLSRDDSSTRGPATSGLGDLKDGAVVVVVVEADA